MHISVESSDRLTRQHRRSPGEAQPEPAQIDALTGIRGFAALWVMLLHLQYYRPHGVLGIPGIRHLIGDGWLAVDLFFVLSGFIMMHVHGRDFLAPTLARARRFYALRFIRIYPVHFVVLILHVPLLLLALRMGMRISNSAFSMRSFDLSLLLLNGWGFPGSEGWNVPSWSVSSEWFAYLLFPMIAVVVHRVQTRCRAVTLGALILMSAWFIGGLVSHWQKYMLPFSGVLVRVTTEFCLGCLAYRFYTRPLESRVAERVAELSLAAIVVVSLLALPATFNVLTIAAFVTLVVGLSQANGPLGSALKSRIAVYLGRISYSAYIVHALVLAVYARALRLIPAKAGFLIETLIVLGFIALVIPSAHILHSMVEEPARRWLRRTWLSGSAPRVRAATSIP
jgi:peptidoglycan/LPS O-acetylase OafA/YrhL